MMMNAVSRWATAVAASLIITAPYASAADPAPDEIVRKSLDAAYYAGNNLRAKVSMKLINSQGSSREREMTMLRLNQPAGEQRYYIYFHAPADVKGTSFLVWKYLGKEDDRWIYVPAVKLVRRIAADDKRSSFVGSDFTYEDVSGREVGDETHQLLRSEDFAGRPAYVLESRPKASMDYARRVSWIDRERWLPLKEEYFDSKNQPIRTFSADKIEQIGKFWTITARSMKNQQTGHRTQVTYNDVSYDQAFDASIFTERYLRDAPKQWVR